MADVALIVAGALCLLVGFVGCVVPVLPGVACAYATVLICITYSAVLIMNWIIKRFGTSRAFVEEEA